MKQPTALLIDDEPDIRELLAISLKKMGFECLQAASFDEGRNLINATKCDLCITDVRMPDGSGIELVRQFKRLHPNTPIAVMTAYDTTDIAVQAMKAGAFDFLAKPIRAQRLEALISEASLLSKTTIQTSQTSSSETIIGDSPCTQLLREGITTASSSLAPVLIAGESGTGKGLVARTIHHQSQRKYGPFIAVDCSAIPSEILESEFFGHKEHSFAGASSDKTGLLQSAHGGSLFLNNVGNLPIYFQAKLLRALKDRVITSIGSSRTEPIEVRVICATNKTLDTEVRAGSFREDFYYYLNVIALNTSPLREHKEDISLISNYLLAKIGGDTLIELEPDALATLCEYTFPGNVLELGNILQRAAATCNENRICIADLNFSQAMIQQNHGMAMSNTPTPLEIKDLEAYLGEVENEIITAVLEAEKWNRTKAAKRLGLTPRQFRYKLAKYRLEER